MALPSNVSRGIVSGRFISSSGVPYEGLRIRFKPDLKPAIVKVLTASPKPVTINVEPEPASTDENGDVYGSDGVIGVSLLDPNDADISPRGWTWNCTIEGPSFPRVEFSFPLTSAGVDLTTVIPVPPSIGADIAAWQAATAATLANVAAAQTARTGAEVARDEAVEAAASVPTEAELSTTIATAVAPKLDKGEAATTYAKSGVESTQRLMALLKNEARNATIAFFGDSTGNETTEWIYKLAQAVGADWPRWTVLYRLWNDTTSVYDAAVTIQTGTGSRTLTVYNASVAGATTLDWAGGSKYEAAVAGLSPELVVISLGHNEQASYVEPGWFGRYLTLTETIASTLAGANILCIAQNPATANTYQASRAEVYREIAAHRGFGFIDVHQAFLDTGNAPGLTLDGIHPNTAGTALWLSVVRAAFVHQPGIAPRLQPPTPVQDAGVDLLKNGDFSAFSDTTPFGFTASNCTTAKDSAVYESEKGWSLKVTASAAGATLIQDVLVRQAFGRWITLKARIRLSATQGASAGRIAIVDSNGSILSETSLNGRDSFKDVIVTKFVQPNATYLRVIVYPAHTDGVGVVNIENLTLSLGKYPKGRPVETRRVPGPAGATTSRGSASAAGAGACYFDTTLGKPVWSNGTAWRDAMGTAV